MYVGQTVLRLLENVLKWLLIVSVVGLLLTMTGQVLLRYVFKSSFVGVEEISILFGLWLYFTGMALVSVHDRHIRGGFVLSLLSPGVVAVLRRIFALISAAICFYYFLISLEYLQFITSIGRRSTFLRLPSYLWVASLSLGLLLSAAVFALKGLERVRKVAQ